MFNISSKIIARLKKKLTVLNTGNNEFSYE